MKTLFLTMLAALAFSQTANAASTDTDVRSPYDTNPACLDRNVDASKGDCIINDTGKPRQKYPPRTPISNTTIPAKPATPAVAAPREAAPASSRKGG